MSDNSLLFYKKGITSNVTLGAVVLKQWNQYKIFDDWTQEVKTIENKTTVSENNQKLIQRGIPAFFKGEFTIPEVKDYPLDTFLRLDGWSKGIAFLNGFNLGRYWTVGPQLTLYSPSHLFKPYPQKNSLVILELEESPCHITNKCLAQFVKIHVLNGTVPDAF